MKILLANKYHYLRGGAERAYFDTAKILSDAGHDVAFFSMHHPNNEETVWQKHFVERSEYSDDRQSFWRKMRIACKILWNFEAQRKLENLLDEFEPDVVHLHNIYHQLSPSIIWTLKKRGIPMVMTLHDYKVISPNYSLFVRGAIWENSKPKRYYRCISDRCVKDSFVKSFICTAEAYLHAWLKSYEQVDVFIAPSKFLIGKFREFGFSKDIEYVPQPVLLPSIPDSMVLGEDIAMKPSYFLFFGRLSAEKGVDVAIEAMRTYAGNAQLWIVGEGPESDALHKRVQESGSESKIIFLGSKHGDDLQQCIDDAKAIIIPSVWYENMPYVLIESLRSGKTVIVSDIGGISERIRDTKNGFLFAPGAANELAMKMTEVDRISKTETRTVQSEARMSASFFTSEAYLESLESVYSKAKGGRIVGNTNQR